MFDGIYNNVDMIDESADGLGSIFLGNWEAVKDVQFLKDNEIKFILSVIPENLSKFKTIQQLGITQKVINAEDAPGFYLMARFDEAADFIYESRKNGNVLVHCAAGISRSTTCLISYYIKYKKMSMEGAFSKIKARRTFACPNVGFQKQLTKYQNMLRSKQ